MSTPNPSARQQQIAQARKMATEDPDNELGHYNLGRLLKEDGQHAEAAVALSRTLELNPQFSKVYQLLGESLLEVGQRDQAIRILREGFAIADQRGDYMPRDAMSRLLTELGEPAPVSQRENRAEGQSSEPGQMEGGFRCQRPLCLAGGHARQLLSTPFNDDLGRRIQETVCMDCWNDWVRNYSIKVINEYHLDLRLNEHQATYDRAMREFLGLE